MPTTVEFELGPSGDFTTWADAMTAMRARTPVTSDEMVYLNVAADFTLGNSTTDQVNSNTDPTRHIVVRPKPGMGWRDLNPTAYSRPTTGIRLTLNAGAGGSLISSAGFVFEDFLIDATGTTATKPPMSMGSATLATFGGMRRNWIACDTTNTYQIVVRRFAQQVGSNWINQDYYFFEDNIVEATGSATTEALAVVGFCCIQRNLIKAAGRAMRVLATAGASPVIRNGAFWGDVLIEHGASSNMNADGIGLSGSNYVTGVWTRTGTGTTFAAGTFIEGMSTAAWDAGGYRPASGGPLIDAADTTAAFKMDILNQNRGASPDVGPIQRTAGVALPDGAITSQSVSGQEFSIAGTHTGATGGELRLKVDGTAIYEAGIVIAGGNWTAEIPVVAAGTYAVEVELTNSGGPFLLNGSSVVVDVYTGDPEGPPPAEPTEPPVVSNVEGVPTAPTTATINADTTRSGGTMWVVVTGSATAPTKVQIKAGQNHLGADAGAGRKLNQAVGAPGTRSLSASSLTAEATYYAHAYHEHPDGDSNVGSSSAFTQPAVVIAPAITDQPDSLTVEGGENAVFSATATGTGPLAYQWRRDGANISGATSSSYTLVGATIDDSGAVFTCFVSGPGGSVLSNPATLTVRSAAMPVAPAPISQAAWYFGARRRAVA